MVGLIQFIACRCGLRRVVGINGKRVYFPIGKGTVELVNEPPEEMTCPRCGRSCKIQDSAEVER